MGKLKTIQEATLSQMAERWIHLNGRPFSLDAYPMYKDIYDGRYKRTLFKTGRQVAKSTTLANFSIIECALIPFFSTMFVTPSKEQTTRFSTTRVNKTMNYSPIIKKRFLHPDLSDRVFHKQFTNGSEMLFTYGFDDADRLRGPSTDRNCFDECFDKNAYVLTYKGWILVSELTKDDLVADVNDTGVVEWNRPTRVFTKKFTGKMVTFKHQGFYLRVTEDHNLWLNYHVKPNLQRPDKYRFESAINAATTSTMGFKMTSYVEWPKNTDKSYMYTPHNFIFWKEDFNSKKRVTVEDVVDENVSCFTVKYHRPIIKGSFKSRPCVSGQCQDMLYDPVIVVGNETMSNSDYHFETYAGTPKTMENTIQYLWEISTQTEWVMKCPGCSKYTYIDNEAAVGNEGPICVKCKAYLDPTAGTWIDLNPGKSLKGFHISQLIMPQNVPLSMKRIGQKEHEMSVSRWDRILQKRDESPISTFRNEVLGVSDSIGTRLISKEELEALCVEPPLQLFPSREHMLGCDIYVAGIDWSGGGTTGVSRTVVWIWGHNVKTDRLVTKAYKVYPGLNPVEAHEEIVRVCKAYNVKFVVGDAGEGALANDLMRKGLGHHRVTQVQYGSNKHALEFNNVDRYLGDRTTLIDNFFMFLKDKKASFGPLAEMKVAIDDMLNEYEEVTTLGKKVWRHFPQKPDDCLHAALLGWIAWKITSRDLRFWQE